MVHPFVAPAVSPPMNSFCMVRNNSAMGRKTITDPKRLRTELGRIRRLGWARDQGENAPSIQAFAAPVFSSSGKMEAALSVPFLAGTEPSRMEEIRMAAIATARAMSEAMP